MPTAVVRKNSFRTSRWAGAKLAGVGLLGLILSLAARVEMAQAAAYAPMTAPEYQFLAMLNSDRQAQGLPALAANGVLSGLARQRSQQLLSSGIFSHYTSAGRLAFADLLNATAFPYIAAGENLAENNYGLSQSLDVANTGLMNSPTHRGNILSSRYNEVGVGIAGPSADGFLYYTQIFAEVR